MNPLKSIFALAAAALFAVSCSQPESMPNAANTTANRAVVGNTAVNSSNNNIAAAKPAQDAQIASVDDKVKDLYTEKCMICHKDTGRGGKLTLEGKTIEPGNLTSPKIKAKSDEKLLSEIKEGIPDEGMPSFKDKLSDEEIKSIIQKIRTFK